MDIFVRNIPAQASDSSLKRFFEEKFSAFGIDVIHCQKLRSKTLANITVLEKDKAAEFLRKYGTTALSRTPVSILKFMNVTLHCQQSRNPPDELILRALKKKLTDKENKPNTTNDGSRVIPVEQKDRRFGYTTLACGRWEYTSLNELVFVSQTTTADPGFLVLGKKNIILVEDLPAPKKQLSNNSHRFRVDIPTYSVDSITIDSSSRHPASLTLSLRQAPKFYQIPPKQSSDVAGLFSDLSLSQAKKMSDRIRSTGLSQEHREIAGSCLVYRVYLTSRQDIASINRILGKTPDMPPSITMHTEAVSRNERHSTTMARLQDTLAKYHGELGFDVAFQVMQLAQNGCLSPHTVLQLLQIIRYMINTSGKDLTAQAISNWAQSIPFPGPESDHEVFSLPRLASELQAAVDGAKKDLQSRVAAIEKHPHLALVHRVMITPTGVYLNGPDLESKNRVLRKYPDHISQFVRVTFADEDGEKMFYERGVSQDYIFQVRFRQVLEEGVRIGGSLFEFLGFSHSSLREHTSWFMSQLLYNGRLLDAKAVILQLGDFGDIRTPAKCAARIGQAFSETNGVVDVPPRCVKSMPDVERNTRTFSDGVGTVSMETLQKIWREHPLTIQAAPTMYQIRFEGAKGMISLDSRIPGEALRLRPSMIKFQMAKASQIEICGAASKPLPMHLNRQYIKIMEDLGVNTNVFMRLQDDAVDTLRKTTLSAINASKFIKSQRIGTPARIGWLVKKLHSIGFEFLEDHFLRASLELAVLSKLRDLKHRARIPVEKATTMYGIMDETGFLAEGQIYCRMNDSVVTGTVTVTRAPALHPGDIQVVRAVDVPASCALKDIHNCIVFSQHGQRDLPSMLSGGDLDGDLYSVIWDQRLLPSVTDDAADYPKVPSKDVGRLVTTKDITNFFLEFMQNDQLGRIANIHVQLADVFSEGTFHPNCLKLAELHSTAVDFSKTGIPVDLTQIPKYRNIRPDFMAPSPRVRIEKDMCSLQDPHPDNEDAEEDDMDGAFNPDAQGTQYYESKKILGKLYRNIDERSFLDDLQRQANQLAPRDQTGESLIRRLLAYVLSRVREVAKLPWSAFINEAKEIKETYEDQTRNTIYQYSTNHSNPITEVEVFVGTLLGKDGGIPNKHAREASIGMKDTFDRDMTFIVEAIHKGLGERNETVDEGDALMRSIACFWVSVNTECGTVEARPRRNLESFRYIAASVCLWEVEKFLG